jgi:hypothetical protein
MVCVFRGLGLCSSFNARNCGFGKMGGDSRRGRDRESSAKASYLTSGLMTASFRDSADDVDIIGEVGGRMERMVGKLSASTTCNRGSGIISVLGINGHASLRISVSGACNCFVAKRWAIVCSTRGVVICHVSRTPQMDECGGVWMGVKRIVCGYCGFNSLPMSMSLS